VCCYRRLGRAFSALLSIGTDTEQGADLLDVALYRLFLRFQSVQSGIQHVRKLGRGYRNRHVCDGQAANSSYRTTVRSRALSPFHRIWTPMQTRMNDERRIITFIAESPSVRAMRSANR
jgi:hypothetical protein